MRRFLQHVLPRGFKKVRHYGILSSKHKPTLARLKLVFGEVEAETEPEPKMPFRPLCPVCGKPMRLVMQVAPYHARASPNKMAEVAAGA